MKPSTIQVLAKLNAAFLVLGTIGLCFFVVALTFWLKPGQEGANKNPADNLNIWISALVFYLISYAISFVISCLLLIKNQEDLSKKFLYRLQMILGFLPVLNLASIYPSIRIIIQKEKETLED